MVGLSCCSSSRRQRQEAPGVLANSVPSQKWPLPQPISELVFTKREASGISPLCVEVPLPYPALCKALFNSQPGLMLEKRSVFMFRAKGRQRKIRSILTMNASNGPSLQMVLYSYDGQVTCDGFSSIGDAEVPWEVPWGHSHRTLGYSCWCDLICTNFLLNYSGDFQALLLAVQTTENTYQLGSCYLSFRNSILE